MVKHSSFLFLCLFLGLSVSLDLLEDTARVQAQESAPDIRVTVDMVQLNVAVTDNKGNYVTGLAPQDFAITEDGIPERIATFGEGNEPTRRLVDVAGSEGRGPSPAADSAFRSSAELQSNSLGAAVAGAKVFILFDTSNYMYRGFVFAQDAIAD